MRIRSAIAHACPVVFRFIVFGPIGAYTGIRYVSDLTMVLAASAQHTLGINPVTLRMELAADWYNKNQTHLLQCPECTWMIGPWPFNKPHAYCDQVMSEQNYGRSGHYSTAVASCTSCRYPISAKELTNETHVCEAYPERFHQLRRRPFARLRELISA